MTPCDIKGTPICRGDVAICQYEGTELCFGVVSFIHDSGMVSLQVITTNRAPRITKKDLIFPGTQVCLIDFHTIPQTHPEFDLLNKFHRMYK